MRQSDEASDLKIFYFAGFWTQDLSVVSSVAFVRGVFNGQTVSDK